MYKKARCILLLACLLISCAVNAQINRRVITAEYYIDTDPGTGLATPLVAADGSFTDAFESVIANNLPLTLGTHTVGVRVKDFAGNWSPAFTNAIAVGALPRTINVSLAEYFIDTDPGVGIATPLIAFNGSFNDAFETAVANGLSLTAGNHTIGVRVKDVANNWSPTFTNTVAVGAAPRAINITAAEYFIDTDPGVGLATTMLAFDGNFNDAFEFATANTFLTAGNHKIGVRVKDFANNWSPTFTNVVNVQGLRTIRLALAEYFIDTDPGAGLAAPMLAFNGSFNDAFETVVANGLTLTQGNHTIGVRVKDFDNNWSPTFSNTVAVGALPRTIRLTAAEYFIDTDPGVGLATTMLAFDGNFNDAFETVIANGLTLTAGNHLVGVRVKDFDNNWSPTFSNVVAAGALPRTINITTAEYFIDSDPGVGLATTMLAFDGNFNDAFESVAANGLFLTSGNHTIGVRVKDVANNWSPTFTNAVNVQGLRTIRLTAAEYFIDTDPGVGLATSMLAFDGNFSVAFETVVANGLTLIIGNHTIGVRVKDFDNNWSPTFSNTVAVGAATRTIRLAQAEYFIDTDPGVGAATTMLAFDGNFTDAFETVAANLFLIAGNHLIGVRVKDFDGNWSPTFSNVTNVQGLRTIRLTLAEYFIDTDPGAGMATPMLAFNGSFNDAFETVIANSVALTQGNHTIGLRVKDFDNNWSPTFTNAIAVGALPRTIRLTAAEYFIDSDPGVGLATTMLAFDGNYNDAFESVIKNGLTLTAGNHLVGVRVKDFDNNWSPTFSNTVAVGALPRAIQLAQAEYFWDTDPGQGNGTPLLAVNGSFNDAFEAVAASVITPPQGIHKLSVRVKDIDNNWSPVFSNAFVSESCDTAVVTATSTITCPGASTIFAAAYSSMNGIPSFQWKLNNINVGTNAATYTSSTLVNGDIVKCVITSAGTGCASGPQSSNSITMTGVTGVVPLVSIGAGTTVIPCTGNAVALTAVASNTTPNNSLSLDGINDYATMPDFGIGTSNFTIEAWIKPNTLAGYIISNRTSEGSSSGNWFNIQVNGSGKLVMELAANNSTYQVFTGNLTIAAAAWSHIAVVRNGTSILFYVNGNLDATFSDPTVRNLFGTNGLLGGWPNFNSAWFNGQIDEFRIWNVVRTVAQISGNMTSSIPGSTTGLTRYYKMNEASGTVISSSAGALSQGTLVSGAALIPATAPVNPYFTYLWSPGGATTAAIGAATAGSYTVLVTNDLGCATLSPPVTVTSAAPLTPPVITPANPVNLCQAQTVTLSANYPVGKGLQFAGSNDYVTVPDAASHRLSTAFTMEAWINPTNFSDYRQIINKFNNAGNYAYMFLTDATTGRLRLDVSIDGITPTTFFSTTSTTAGLWQHVAVTWNGSTITFYINGVASGGGSFSGTLFPSTLALSIGHRSVNSGQPFIGRIDDARVWDVALSQAQIQAWKDKPVNASHPLYPNLKGYWKLDEGTGTTAGDASAYGNTGTLVGSPLPTWIISGGLSYYQWSNGLQSPTAFINTTGLYSVTCTTTEGCTSTSGIDSVTIHQYKTPAVSIASDTTNTICAGTNVTFTATPVNGGLSPSYQWQKNNVNTGSNSATYSNNTLVSGDVITCAMTSNYYCLNTPTASSNNITITVTPNVTPLVSIAPSTPTTICAGTNVTFTATPSNGGTTPAYQWKKNNANVGTNSATYTDNGLVNGDIITCVLTSNVLCVTSATANSNTVTMTVNPNLTPTVSIGADTTSTICAGTNVTFTAIPTNGGTVPAYQWKKNNINVGTNSATYADNGLVNGDVITCLLTSNEVCVTAATANSNAIAITVTANVTPLVLIIASDTIICTGTNVIFTATAINGGTTPVYQWKKNTINVGTNSITYTDNALVNGDVITCELISNELCVTSNVSTSGSIVMDVNTTLTSSTAATGAVSTAPFNEICLGNVTSLSLTGGSLGTGATWNWYSGSCGGTPVGTGASVNVTPGVTTTYFVRAEGACNTTPCQSITIAVSAAPDSANVLLPFTGMPAYLCTGTTATLSIAPVSGATQYTWDVPTGGYFNGNPLNVSPFTTAVPTVQVTYGAPIASLYTTGVQAGNACGNSVRKTQKTRGTTSVPAAVTGPLTACANSSIVYTTGVVSGAASYLWTITGNATVTGTGNTVTVNFGPTWNGGTLCVAAQTTCYTSPTKCITISKSAAALNAISGTFTACPNSVLSYSVPVSAGTASYTWMVPTGATVTSGQGTNAVSVTYAPGYSAVGNICVSTTSICGVVSALKCKTVAPGLPTVPASISGPPNGLCGQSVVYTCPAQGTGTTYTWTVPTGATLVSGQGSTAINTNYGSFTTGNLCVRANNNCGSSAYRCIAVKGAPTTPGAITALPSSWCANTEGIEFNVNVSAITGSYSLNWIYPTMPVATYVFGAGNSSSLILDWGIGIGNINVTAFNACGSGTKTSTWSSTCREGEKATATMVVYPNPTTGVVTVTFTTKKGNAIIEVMDFAGRVVMKQNAMTLEGENSQQLDMSKLAKGVYMLNVQSMEGNRQRKVVVE